jgi:hypothetical protein
MNNAFRLEEPAAKEPNFEEEARLVKIIESVAHLLSNEHWQTLQSEHFAKEEERVNRLLLSQTQSDLNEKEIYRLQGELRWARRYADFTKFAQLLKNQLDNLKHG